MCADDLHPFSQMWVVQPDVEWGGNASASFAQSRDDLLLFVTGTGGIYRFQSIHFFTLSAN
jgi:hypothetical protein